MDTLKIILIIVLVTALLLALIGNFFFSFALKTNSPISADKVMTKILAKNKEALDGYSGYTGTKEERAWFEEKREDVYITSKDGLKLHGFEVKNENGNGNYIISCHGYSGSADDMARYALRYYQMGYSVILPDARAHGKSEGSARGMGWPERLDILVWIDKILDENPNANIGLFGVSMGGATVMMASGEKLPEQVKAIVEDCGYTSAWEEFEGQLKGMFHLPSFPIMNVSSAVTKIRGGYSLKEASAIEQVKKSETPTLFIHGSNDTFVPFAMLDKVYEAASCEKEKLVVPDAGHAMSSTKNPKLYWETIKSFLDKHM